MAIYFEPSSGVGNSTAELIEHAPNADVEELARRRGKARAERAPLGRRTARFFRHATAHSKDAIPPGTCARCGRIADHATSEDCIEQLRDEIADLTNAELRVGKPRRRGRK